MLHLLSSVLEIPSWCDSRCGCPVQDQPGKPSALLTKQEEIDLTRVTQDYLGIQYAQQRLSKVLRRAATVAELAEAMKTEEG